MRACSLPPAMPAEEPEERRDTASPRLRSSGIRAVRALRIGIEAHVVNRHPSGNGRVVANLVEAIARVSDHRVFAYVTDPSVAASWARTAPATVTIRKVPLGSNPFLRIPAVLPAMAIRDRVDVFLSHDVRPPAATFPVVTLVHDVAFERHPEFFSSYERAWMTKGFRWACRHSDGVITVSNFTRDEIVSLYGVPRGRVTVAPNGVDPIFTSSGPTTGAGAAPIIEPPYFLAVGTLQPRKNLATLIRAYRSLRARMPTLGERLVIVGGPGYQAGEIVKEADDLRRRGLLTFTGYVGGEEVATLMRHATAFAYPSLYEGFGLPPLEAMAAGAPVAVSDIPVTREVLGEAALFAPSMDVDAWSRALETLATDAALRDRLIAAGRVHAADFTWERSARAALAALERVARPPRRQAP